MLLSFDCRYALLLLFITPPPPPSLPLPLRAISTRYIFRHAAFTPMLLLPLRHDAMPLFDLPMLIRRACCRYDTTPLPA